MKSETIIDSTALTNEVLEDMIDVERIEEVINSDLTSMDLFNIDCAILTSLEKTKDFSKDLLLQLEKGLFKNIAAKPPKSIETQIKDIQQQTIMDITLPLQDMFDEMAVFVSKALEE